MKLKDKVAIVTGAASGMGKAIAIRYAKEGAKVVLSDINEQALNEVVRIITSDGGTAFGVLANVGKIEDIEHLVDTTVDTYKTVDILVNNAGIMDNFLPVGELTDEIWDRVININTSGPMRLIRKCLPIFLEKQQGIIINNASIGGLHGSRAGAAYTASKHALIGLTKNIGFQYSGLGIRCNAIAPGGVNTNIGTTMNNPDKFGMERAMSGASLNPRFAEADEIAGVALFLASDDASFVNGAVITADGGWTAY
ncbi:MAG: SDR family oxidoreductase [Clostridiales bacterium]|jgi:NAD(P)-dependent dehydrogenase (short-subunit alcohol dehydrogenase family)|nr:SDR family oxidoreductase [Clostridiales bacterium]